MKYLKKLKDYHNEINPRQNHTSTFYLCCITNYFNFNYFNVMKAGYKICHEYCQGTFNQIIVANYKKSNDITNYYGDDFDIDNNDIGRWNIKYKKL